MYQAFEDYACPTQFPVILKTDEKRLVSSYIVFWVLRDYFPSPCMTTPPQIVKSRCVVIFRCVVIAPPLPDFPPDEIPTRNTYNKTCALTHMLSPQRQLNLIVSKI